MDRAKGQFEGRAGWRRGWIPCHTLPHGAKIHWSKVKISRAPAQAFVNAVRKLNKQDIGEPDVPPEYEGDDRLAELSWFKKGEASRRWPARVTDDSGREIKDANELDWSGFDDSEGLAAQLRFASKVAEALSKGLASKP